MKRARFACPCCGYKTFSEKPTGNYSICQVCFWEDDPITHDDPDFIGGANRVSLRQAQNNFMEYGACTKSMIKNVRQPTKDEERDSGWQPIKS